jgi:hypothetical protein
MKKQISSSGGNFGASFSAEDALREKRTWTLEAVAMLTPGKPVVLGSLDIPGTTRREVIEVVSELVR